MLTSIGPRPPAIGQCVKHAVKTFDGLLARYVNSINKSANIVLNPYCFKILQNNEVEINSLIVFNFLPDNESRIHVE